MPKPQVHNTPIAIIVKGELVSPEEMANVTLDLQE
jgi:hypothetical protein